MKILYSCSVTILFIIILFTYSKNRFESNIDNLEVQLKNYQSIVKIDNKINKLSRLVQKWNSTLDSRKIANKIYEMTVQYPNLDINLICAVITHESAHTWSPTIKSKAGAVGLMQIMSYTAKLLTGTYVDLTDPYLNIELGSKYLSCLINLYGLAGGLAAYNGGMYRANLWVKSNYDDKILFKETRHYVPTVLQWYKKYKEG